MKRDTRLSGEGQPNADPAAAQGIVGTAYVFQYDVSNPRPERQNDLIAANSTANDHTATVTLTSGGQSYILSRTVFEELRGS